MDQPPPAAGVQTNGNNPSLTRRVAKPQPNALFGKKAPRKIHNIKKKTPTPEPEANGFKLPNQGPLASSAPSVEVSGFSDPQISKGNVKYTDYKLVTTKRELLQGMRYHLLHFTKDNKIDIRSEQAFPKPAHLHRRDARSKAAEPVKDEAEDPKDGMTAEQRAEHVLARERRQKEREENLAQVAPSLTAGRKAVKRNKTQQVYRSNFTDEQKRTIQNNYEEKLPWHLEDWNGKNVFIGQNKTGSTRTHVAFSFDPSSGKYRMIPVEKVYTFEAPPKVIKYRNELTLEEAETLMRKKKAVPNVFARHDEAILQENKRKIEEKMSTGLYTGGHQGIYASRGGEEGDLDFEDDFADDEEGDMFEEKDEDEKTAEKKIKEDQLQANFMDFKDDRDFDVLEERERRDEEAKKKNFRDVRKALAKREGNYNQGSDSDEDDSTDSEEERQRLEAEKLKKEEEAASRVPSGANTPSGRKEKQPGVASDREKKPRPLKRPGSPNLSDASGTDASVARKKKKTKHISSSQQNAGGSRPMSPDNANLDPSSAASRPINRRASSHTQASDTEGGAMSDGTKKTLKLKLKSTVKSASPPTSRPSSPPPPAIKPITTAEEARALIPPGGIASKEFMAKAGASGASGKENLAMIMPLIKAVARIENGRIYPKLPKGTALEVKKEVASPGVKKEPVASPNMKTEEN